MLTPTVRRTWAPVGQTPIIRHRYNHARISVIGGLTISPQRKRLGFYFRPHARNISTDEVEDFLWHLLKHLRGHVFVIWDGASIHSPRALKGFLIDTIPESTTAPITLIQNWNPGAAAQ